MYGLVHQAAQAMAREQFGEDGFQSILKASGLDSTHFLKGEVYDDETTFALVGAICEHANLDADTLLRAFGKYWIAFVSTTIYGELMDRFGDTLEEFVDNLDAMHLRVEATMPEARLPSFEITNATETTIRIQYRSQRTGLEAFVAGLFEGLLDRFGETGTIAIQSDDEGAIIDIEKVALAATA